MLSYLLCFSVILVTFSESAANSGAKLKNLRIFTRSVSAPPKKSARHTSNPVIKIKKSDVGDTFSTQVQPSEDSQSNVFKRLQLQKCDSRVKRCESFTARSHRVHKPNITEQRKIRRHYDALSAVDQFDEEIEKINKEFQLKEREEYTKNEKLYRETYYVRRMPKTIKPYVSPAHFMYFYPNITKQKYLSFKAIPKKKFRLHFVKNDLFKLTDIISGITIKAKDTNGAMVDTFQIKGIKKGDNVLYRLFPSRSKVHRCLSVDKSMIDSYGYNYEFGPCQWITGGNIRSQRQEFTLSKK